MLHHVLSLLLGGGAVLLSLAEQQLSQFVLFNTDLVVIGHLVEDNLGFEGVQGTLLDLSPEVVGVIHLLFGVFEILFDGHTGLGQLLVDLLTAGFELRVDEVGRQLNVDLGDNLLQHLVAGVRSLVEASHILQSGAQVGTHLVDSVELTDQLGEVVVNGRELLLTDFSDGDLNVGILAAQRAANEGGVELCGLTRLETGNGLIKAFQHALGTDLVGDTGCGGVFESLAVAGSSKVNSDEVVLDGSALDLCISGKTLAQGLDALVNVLIRHLNGRHLNGDGGDVGKIEVRTNVHLGGELDDLAILQLGHLDLGLAQGNDRVLLDGLAISSREGVVDGLLKDDPATETLVDNRSGHLSLAEAGNVHLVGDVLVGLVKAGLQFIEGHLDRELHTVSAELLKAAGHEVSPVVPILSSPLRGVHIPSNSSDAIASEPPEGSHPATAPAQLHGLGQ